MLRYAKLAALIAHEHDIKASAHHPSLTTGAARSIQPSELPSVARAAAPRDRQEGELRTFVGYIRAGLLLKMFYSSFYLR